jgi:alpha-methylacyl-CoA racemase
VTAGPLGGLRVVELAAIGPVPFAAMVLADLGAEVLRLDRLRPATGMLGPGRWNLLNRGRATVGVDLKSEAGRELTLRLVERADVVLEGFRPGVMERLGLGPDVALARNRRLVYGRMTGYGQDGPLAPVAGHDIDYIALAGVLGSIARSGERPLFPLNLVGDFGGGGMLLALGVLAATLEARISGRGQVVDAAMVDGAALLSTFIFALRAGGFWTGPPGENVLDSGAPFYEVYETADGGHVAVGAIEPQFYAELLVGMGIDPAQAPQWDQARWPALKARFAAVFRTRTRDEWEEIFAGSDACVMAVLSVPEAIEHPHNVARGTFVDVDGTVQPAPAPRFSRTPAPVPGPPQDAADLPADGLEGWGVSAGELRRLRADSVVA